MHEFKILGHIDLPEKKLKPEEFRGLLETKMAGISQSVNEEFATNFLDSRANILMADHPNLETDQKFVADLENNWASEHHKTVEQWRQDKDRNPATITEMAITLALHKLLGKRFIVARASALDDYQHGVDNVLIDKETGAVVCGFDEVLGNNGDDGADIKSKKIKNTLARGGTSLKYGATIINGKLERQSLHNIPTFYLAISKDELISLLKDFKNSESPTANEKSIVLKMIASLDSQYEEANKIVLNPALQKNLEKFSGSLEIIRQQIG